jgi:hypothetical protein
MNGSPGKRVLAVQIIIFSCKFSLSKNIYNFKYGSYSSLYTYFSSEGKYCLFDTGAFYSSEGYFSAESGFYLCFMQQEF